MFTSKQNSNIYIVPFQTLLLLSCSGIAFGLAVLGVYCDPHLRLHSWYSHRIWPYKRFIKEKSLRESVIITENITIYNVTGYDNETGRPWHRIGEEFYNTSIEPDWSIKLQEKEEFIWLPVLMLSVVLFLYNVGLGSVPYVLISELFSVNVSIAFI